MTIQRLATSRLSPDERLELESAIADPARFHSDGREVGQAAIILPLILLLLEIYLIADVSSWSYHENPFEGFIQSLPGSLRNLASPEFLYYTGLVAIPAVMIAVAAYGWRTRGRHGFAFTSYGVVRVRGHALRLLRYADMVGVTTAERNLPQHRVITDELELKARDGKSLTLYGFGLGRWQRLVEAHMREAGSGARARPKSPDDVASAVRPGVPEDPPAPPT